MRTKVFITIDTEFSIAGAFEDPDNNEPCGAQMVLCEVDGQSHGLGFLLETFSTFGVKATFFVEALNTHYFGDQPMGDLARRIRRAGQDVQLHLHPCWTYFKNPDWKTRLEHTPPNDEIAGKSVDEVEQWLLEGLAAFDRWGIERPVAFRTGNLMVDRNVYRAMARVEIRVGSNVGLAVFSPPDPSLHYYSGIHQVENVLEASVLTYADFQIGDWKHLRTLTVTGSSWNETRSLLLNARRSGLESVVVLTHPFEYVKGAHDRSDGLVPNRINQRRLRQLCAFLRDHGDDFESASMAELADNAGTTPSEKNVMLKVAPLLAVERLVENGLNGWASFRAAPRA